MVVYYLVSSPQIAQNKRDYVETCDLIRSLGAELVNEHGAATYYEIANDLADQEDFEIVCQKSLECVQRSDVCVVDATNKSTFGVGFLSAKALELKKPILLLLRENTIGGSFICGLRHPLVTRQYYNDNNLSDIISNYLHKVKA